MKESKLPKEYSELSFSMSEFQIKHFVVGAQHNVFRQFKQILLELEVRYTNWEQIELDIERNRLDRDLILEKISNESSPAQINIYNHDIKKLDIGFDNNKRALERLKMEVSNLEKLLEEFRGTYDVKELMSHQEEYEHDYWIKRLATQSALELLTVGRIGSGNLEALMQMGPDNFRKSLAETTKIANEIKGQVKYLDTLSDHEMLESREIKEIDIK